MNKVRSFMVAKRASRWTVVYARICALLMLSMVGCFSPSSEHQSKPTLPGSSLDDSRNLKLFWMSLDGLKKEDVVKYMSYVKNPHPRGFNYLLQHAAWNEKLKISNPTITASSHVSTIT